MAPVIVSKRGFLALVLWVLKGRNGCRVIIRIETGHSNLVSCFGPRIRALARYFTSAFASVKYLSQRPHPRAKTWHKIWMTGLNPTNSDLVNSIWQHRSGSKLVRVMTSCPPSPSHYLHKTSLIYHQSVLYHSPERKVTMTVLKMWTICHARDLWKLARSCKQLRLLCPPDP